MKKNKFQQDSARQSFTEQTRKINKLFGEALNQVKQEAKREDLQKKNIEQLRAKRREEGNKQFPQSLNRVKQESHKQQKLGVADIGQLLHIGLTGTTKQRDLATRLLALLLRSIDNKLINLLRNN